MNEEQALVAAIRADPNDNTRRLAFADWLDEHDQPERAAWMRDVEIFWWMGPDYVSPLPQILKQLHHSDPDECDKAGPVVERLRGAAAPMLREAFAAGDEDLRVRIAEIFNWVREGVPRPLPELIADVQSEDLDAARVAVVELQWYGPAAAPAVPALIVAWERRHSAGHGDGTVDQFCQAIAVTFARMGPAAIEAGPLLTTALTQGRFIAHAASDALAAMGSEAATPELRELLADPDACVRYHAALTLCRLAPGTGEPLSALNALLDDPSRWLADLVRQWFESDSSYRQ